MVAVFGPVRSPEQIAEAAVVAEAGHVELRGPGLTPVCVGRHPNPAVVREQAEHLRRFLAAVLRADRETH